MKIFNLGEAAKILEIPFYRLQYLERAERIPKARRSSSGQRFYTQKDLMKLKQILNKEETLEAVSELD